MILWTFQILEKCPGPIFQKPATNWVFENAPFSGSKIPLLAIHKIISHIWEDRSWKVNNDEPDLRFFHGNFWPVISRTVRKPCFSTSIPRGPNLCILGPPTWARLPNAPRDEILPQGNPRCWLCSDVELRQLACVAHNSLGGLSPVCSVLAETEAKKGFKKTVKQKGASGNTTAGTDLQPIGKSQD